jgi:hypothetical protein
MGTECQKDEVRGGWSAKQKTSGRSVQRGEVQVVVGEENES